MRLLTALFLAGALAALLTVPVPAATIHVPADQPTIQSGINAAVDGDTVIVAPGSYVENLDYLGKRIVVTTAGGAGTTQLSPLYPTIDVIKFVSGELAGTEFSGFTVTGSSATQAITITSSPTVKRNVFRDNPVGSVAILATGSPLITRNLFLRTGGISCIGASGSAVILNNTFYQNNRGFYVFSASVVAKNNIVANSSQYGIYGYGGSYNEVWNNAPNYDGGAMAGTGSISVNPQFLSPAAGDFTLLPGSPCINAGDPASGVDPDGTRVDMGAYYVQSGSSLPLAILTNLGPEDTLHVLNHVPRFYWSYYDTLTTSQVSLQIEVGSDSDWTAAELWSSGEILASDTSILYAGGALNDGERYHVRISVSDGTMWGSWKSFTFRLNSVPTMPSLFDPRADTLRRFNGVELEVVNSTDLESDLLSYDYELYSDAGLSAMVWTQTDVTQQSGHTKSSALPSLTLAHQYWWRARSYDGFEYSPWSSAESFITRGGVIAVPSMKPTIASAVGEATSGDTILLAWGDYAEQIDPGGDNLVFLGTSPPESVRVEAPAPGLDVVSITNGEGAGAIVKGMTIRGATTANGIYISNASPQIVGNIIEENSASASGGGIYVASGNPTIRGNIIRLNSSSNKGGGLFLATGASAIIDSNRFYFNSASDGGGAIAKLGTGTITVSYNVLYGNSNTDDWGGAVYIENAPGYSIRNNTIVGNHTTSGNGAGITSLSPQGGQIENNIIASNSGGYGVYVLVSGGTAPTVGYNDSWQNGIVGYLGVSAGTGAISADPLHCDTSQLDFGLQGGSPCIGTGESGLPIGAKGVGCSFLGPQPPAVTAVGIDFPGDNLHVTDETPIISWKYEDSQGRPHTKSQIEVGTDVDWTVVEKWQPSVLIGTDTSIVYAGSPLEDGAVYYVRVRVFNDTLWSNWNTATLRMNSVPTEPTPILPANLSIVLTGRPNLVVTNSLDSEGDTRRYDFEVYRDEALTQLTAYISGVLQGATQTSWKVDSLTFENQQHWWRVRASDGFENGPWSSVRSFWVDAYNQAPSPVALESPANAGATSDLTPQLSWYSATDPDPGAAHTYKITVGLNPGFTFKSEIAGLTDTLIDWPDSLTVGTTYWWKVEANDGRGGVSISPVWSFATVVPCACDCHGDPVCDSHTDVLDVVSTVSVAFRNAAPIIDPNVACPRLPTDLNCSGTTDVIDVVKVVNVAFRNANAATEYCQPCP